MEDLKASVCVWGTSVNFPQEIIYCIQPNKRTVCLKKIGPWQNVMESVI